MRLIFAGTPEVALPSLQLLVDDGHDIAAVLTRADARRGRGRTLSPSPVAAWARERDLNVLTPTTLRDPDSAAMIRDLQADAAAVVAYGMLLPADILTATTHGWVNLHFSLLPAWRGAAPVQHAIKAGDELSGATTFLLDEGMDTGPILGHLTEPIGPTDTAGDLLGRLAHAGAPLLRDSLHLLTTGQASPAPQGADGVSYAPKITTADAEVPWSAPALAVDRHIRAVTPAPGAWTTLRGARLKIGPTTPTRDSAGLGPGQAAVSKHEVLIGTATTAVRLGEVAPAGKGWMAAADWARGAHLDTDSRLGEPKDETR